MFSTLVGICQRDTSYNWVNKSAALVDFFGFVTMVVLATLSLTSTAQFSHLGCMSSYLLLVGGTLGMIILALKNITSSPPSTPIRQVSDFLD